MLSAESNQDKLRVEKKPFIPPAKLWIVDCLRIPQHPSLSNAFEFQSHTIQYVDIFGVITSVRKMTMERFAYQVDDGTGTIACLYNINKPKLNSLLEETKAMEDTLYREGILGSYNAQERKCLDEFLRPSADVLKALLEERSIGETVQISGKLSEFRDIREINVYTMRLVTDLNDEICRMQEMVILYDQGYFAQKEVSRV